MTQENRKKEEIDFHEVVRSPQRLFGYTYFYVLVILLGLGIYYVMNLSIMGKNAVTPVLLRDSSAFAQDIPLQRARVLPPVDIMAVGRSSEELVQRGEPLYAANCSSCHGDDGLGDGPAALMLDPKPRNFQSAEGWTNGQKVSEIYKTLDEGIIKNGMASYNYLPPEDRFALTHYVRTFLAARPEDSPEELQQLEATYRLSQGTSVPGQIPIKKAAAMVIEEQQSVVERVRMVASEIDSRNDTSEGAMLFEREVLDRTRAITCFVVGEGSKTGQSGFVRSVSSDPMASGFRAHVVSLSEGEWTALFRYINHLQ